MSVWWSHFSSIVASREFLFIVAMIFAASTGILFFYSKRIRKQVGLLRQQLEITRKKVSTLEKAASEVRQELLNMLQKQDIDAVKNSFPTFDEIHHKTPPKIQTAIKAPDIVSIRKSGVQPKAQPLKKKAPADLDASIDDGLSPRQCEQLIALLDPGPKGNLDIFYVVGDKKSEKAARKIEKIFSADGWKTNGVARSVFSSPPRGILMVVNSKETAPSYSSFIERVFTNAKIPVFANTDSKYREWSLSVIIGNLDA